MPWPPLKEVISRYGLQARKSLGQHFLLDMNITEKIVRKAGDLAGINVIEIGPGPGGLTRALLDSNAASVTVIEQDERFIPALEELRQNTNRLKPFQADALDIDLTAIVPPPRAIVANLPYNVATPLLIKWLQQAADFASMTLMFQKEVAERIVAKPGSKSYGRLSVMSQWRTDARIVFNLPARAFTPPPKVASSVVYFLPKALDKNAPSWDAMEKVVAAAFNQRRKMLRSSLGAVFEDTENALSSLGIDPTLRAENLTVEQFEAIARA